MDIPREATGAEPTERIDSQRNRRRLIEAATQAIAEKGLEVSALDIATHAGLGVGTLYRRFGTKEALIEGVLVSLVDELLEAADGALADDDPWSGFGSFLTALGESQLESRGLAELAGAHEITSGPLHQRNLKVRRAIKRITERAQQTGALRADISWRDVMLLSRAQVDAQECLGVRARPEQWRRTVTMLLDGLRAPAATPLPGRPPLDTLAQRARYTDVISSDRTELVRFCGRVRSRHEPGIPGFAFRLREKRGRAREGSCCDRAGAACRRRRDPRADGALRAPRRREAVARAGRPVHPRWDLHAARGGRNGPRPDGWTRGRHSQCRRRSQMIRTAPAHGASDRRSGRIVAFERHARARLDGRTGAAPAVRVLIADGQALVRAGLRALLESGGRISVAGEASTGDEAVTEAHRLRPDVVLLDATLPGLNCVEATTRILADPRIAVMLLTATEQDERMIATLRAGARGLLLKDTEPAELVRAIALLARGDALLSPSLTRRLIAELASAPDPQLASSELLDELTPREREVVALVARGLSNPDIAERLVISPATSKTHVSRAMLKLGVHDRAQLVVFAFHAGLAVPRAQAPASEALALGRAPHEREVRRTPGAGNSCRPGSLPASSSRSARCSCVIDGPTRGRRSRAGA